MNNISVLRRLFCHRPLRYLIACALGAAVTAVCLFRGRLDVRMTWIDALTVAGAVVILLGLLGLVSHYGAFDIFGYAFSFFGYRKYGSLYEYSESKKEKRSKAGWSFMPYIIVGLLYLLAGLLVWNL